MRQCVQLVLWVGMVACVSCALNGNAGRHLRMKRQLQNPQTDGLAPSQMSAEDKNRIVERHNQLRAGESATNMVHMSWDEELAAMAQTWANTCVQGHGNPESDVYNGVGQNLAANTGPTFDLEGSMTRWWNEKSGYDINSNTCFNPPCGHYTQMAWARSYLVGCAVRQCTPLANTNLGTAWYFVCNYYIQGNFNGARPYQVGSACQQCPSSHPDCSSQGLCTRANTCSCTEWSEWNCDAACGRQGEQVRTRECTTGCGPESDTGTCTGPSCGCGRCGDWTLWSACDAECNQEGERTRGRSCSAAPGCTLTSEKESCDGLCCNGCDAWSHWSSCSPACGAGIQSRSRRCDGNGCPAERGRQYCFTPRPCGHDGWGRWSEWGSCSTSCQADEQEGYQMRYRQCGDRIRGCHGPGTERRLCQPANLPCEEDTDPDFGGWSHCSVTCGTGFQYRRLPGPYVPHISRRCQKPACRVQGHQCWSDWTLGTRCSGQCGYRYRTCNCRVCIGRKRQGRSCHGLC